MRSKMIALVVTLFALAIPASAMAGGDPGTGGGAAGVGQAQLASQLTCAACGLSRRWWSSVWIPGCRGCVGALRGRGVSADAQAYFGPRLGVAPGRVHDVMGGAADGLRPLSLARPFPGVGSAAGLGELAAVHR
jgi:hypothetical protein